MSSKHCSKCKEAKSTAEFYKNKSSSDGLTSWCKSCIKLGVKKYQENNPEKVKEYNKKYRKNNPEKGKEYAKKWRERNPEKLKEKSRKWRENNPEKEKERKKKWYENKKKNSEKQGNGVGLPN